MGSMNGASAIILAGGRSSRMGLPKAALPFGPSTILERLIETLRVAFAEVVIVAAPECDEPFSIDRTLAGRARDLHEGHRLIVERDDDAFGGPVGALRRGLARAQGEITFASSCDLPLLRAEVATAICALVGDRDGAIPRVDGKLQPLCAAYRREAAVAALAAMEAAGEQRLTALADRIDARIVEEAALRAIDPELHSLINVNTAQDYSRALRLARNP
jgi:molybdenum cofactor guanylyltransferase